MKLLILERDGTVNATGDPYITSADDWTPLPGALEAIARLNHAGYRVVIACNQPVLGGGLIDVATLNAIHARMHKSLAAVGARVDAVFYCPHTAEDACTCRKPLPGLFEQIGERYGVELQGLAACGDNVEHLMAAHAAGCEPHLVLTGRSHGLSPQTLPAGLPPGTRVHADLGAFAASLNAQPLS